MTVEELNKIPVFFIVAKGRSGTTLLQNIFDANKHVVLPFESKLIIHLKSKYLNVRNWNSKLVDQFIADLYDDVKFANHWMVNKEKLTVDLHAVPTKEITFSILCKIIYLNYPSPFPKENILAIGDKNPIYSMFMDDLLEVFPDAKFIHLLRDYRDNILSNLKTFKFEKIPAQSIGWVIRNRNIQIKKNQFPERFYTLKYEELVSDPSKYVHEICDFLSLPFYPEMLHFNEVLKDKFEHDLPDSMKEEVAKVHPNLSKPISTENINKWQNELNEQEIETIEYIVGDFAEQYGYMRSKPKSNKLSIKLKGIVGYCKHSYKFSIIKLYYKLPWFMRSGLRKISNLLYKTFAYTNYFNDADFRNSQESRK